MGILEQNTENFSVIPISNNAYEKIKAYARLMGNCECYGFLMSPIEKNDGIVYDSILASDQEVSSGHARLSADAALNMKEEMKGMGYKPIGFWHSHGGFNAFHSGQDDHNLESLLLSFAVNTVEKEFADDRPKNCYFIEQGAIIVRSDGKEYSLRPKNNDISLSIEPKSKPYEGMVFGLTNDSKFFLNSGGQTLILKHAPSIEIRECPSVMKSVIGVGFSLVVNSKGEEFAEIGKSYICNACNNLKNVVNVGKAKVVIDDGIRFSEQELIANLEKGIRNADYIMKGGKKLDRFKTIFRQVS